MSDDNRCEHNDDHLTGPGQRFCSVECQRCEAGKGDCRDCVHDATVAQLAAVTAERDALAKFKAYVHQRLDEAQVPTHPNGEHGKHGCRIGDRLDIVLGGLDVLADLRTRASAERDAIKAECKRKNEALKEAHSLLASSFMSGSVVARLAHIVRAVLPPEQPTNDAPTHRCKVCGALWWFGAMPTGHEAWSLRSPTCGPCCDNVAMCDQIEPLSPAEESP